MPQTAYVLGMTLKPVKGLMIQKYTKHTIRTIQTGHQELVNMTERMMTKTEVKYGKHGYSKLDLHMSYKLPQVKGLDMTLNGHIFNVLDEVFVQDAVDNSRYNSYGTKEHLGIQCRSILRNTKICKYWINY